VAEAVTTRSGGALYVEDRGRGLPVLAIHGLGGGAWFFSGLAARLEDRCRLIAIDLPGTGRSTAGAGPLAFSAESWGDDLGDLVEHLAAEPVVLLGHSLGTILALQALDAWPHLVRALIFAGGLPEPRPEIRQRLAERAEAVARHGLAGWGPRAAAANFSRATLEEQPELAGLFARLFEGQDAAAYVRSCEILIGASAASLVSTVKVPCLSISGDEDQYAPPDLVPAFVQQLGGPHRQVVLPRCGHLPFLEAPAAFAQAVRSFLDALC
jgi:3-oxoadipate enol-lactonase